MRKSHRAPRPTVVLEEAGHIDVPFLVDDDAVGAAVGVGTAADVLRPVRSAHMGKEAGLSAYQSVHWVRGRRPASPAIRRTR